MAIIEEKLADFELLEPLKTIEFDPKARYLLVARTKERLSLEAHERLFVQFKGVLSQLLGEIKFSLVVIEGDIELDFYQFKEKTDG